MVEQSVVDASLVRVKVWTADGTIVYSNASQLQGGRYLRGLEGVVRDAGGVVRVESEPGRGTTVFVEVPIP